MHSAPFAFASDTVDHVVERASSLATPCNLPPSVLQASIMGCGSSSDIDANATPQVVGVGARMDDLKNSALISPPLRGIPADEAVQGEVHFSNVLFPPARNGPQAQLITMPGVRASATPAAQQSLPPRPPLQRAGSSKTARSHVSSSHSRRLKRHGSDRLGAVWAAEMAREMDAALVQMVRPTAADRDACGGNMIGFVTTTKTAHSEFSKSR